MVQETNPYQPSGSVSAPSNSVNPHGTSLRREAWRGAKFGAKWTAIGMSVVAVVSGIAAFGIIGYTVLQTDKSLLQAFHWLDVAKMLGGMAMMIAQSSFYGGVIGAIVMTSAAVVRKLHYLTTKVFGSLRTPRQALRLSLSNTSPTFRSET
jgi:hypothetical protein